MNSASQEEEDRRGGHRKPIKVIFLDVDGVLCCNEESSIEKDKLNALEYICKATGAFICISSDWRLYPTKKRELTYALKQLKLKIIGSTPSCDRFARPREIIGFITVFNAKMNREEAEGKSNVPKITAFCCIDDRFLEAEEGGERLLGHCVRTSMDTGLTMDLANSAINILNGKV